MREEFTFSDSTFDSLILKKCFLEQITSQSDLHLQTCSSEIIIILIITQVFVVAEAYGYSPDWAEVLFRKVILNGEFAYLEELKQHCPLTPTLFEDIFKK